MIIAIDAGNSLVKWGSYDGTGWRHQGVLRHDEIDQLEPICLGFGVPDAVAVANVAGPEVASAIADALRVLPFDPIWVRSSAQACGVVNRYEQPGLLGVDRWAALVAARARASRACVVVVAGTATTVDVLSPAGEFLGGLILPGLTLMADVLFARTAGIPRAQGDFAPFPVRTRDAVTSGALQATAGAVERMHRELGRAGMAGAACLLSGGGAAALRPLIELETVTVDNLVLEGVARIALEHTDVRGIR